MSQAVRQTFETLISDLPRRPRQALAWCVHLYTALGLIAAAAVAVLIVRGGDGAFLRAFALLLVAAVIDATDGTLARAVRVRQVLPGFDGRRLDDLIDFLTYTALPLLLLWRADILPAGWEAWLLLPLLASAYGFCQVHAKTADGFFLGFPSCWNVVAFYLYVLHAHVAPLPGWFVLGVVHGFALLTFVPSRYLYPTQRGRLNRLTCLLAAAWVCLLAGIVLCLLRPWAGEGAELRAFISWLVIGSLYFPVYYLAASWAVSWVLWRTNRAEAHSREVRP